MAAAGLEARYRRLLGWFPADHRAVHGEEMLGVLMTGADDDRDKPGLRETADLLLGAVRIRLRPVRALSDRDGWRDALAMFSVAGPVLILATVCLVYLVTSLLQGSPASRSLGLGTLDLSALSAYYGQASAIPWLVLSGQGLVVLLVLLGLRRSAAAATALSVAAVIYVQGPYPGLGILGPVLLSELFLLVLPVAQIVALLASPGPRRGRELLRGRHWALLAVAAVAATALTAAFLPAIIATHPPFRQLSWLPFGGLVRMPGGGFAFTTMDPFPSTSTAAAVLLILLLAAWLSSPMGKRLAVLFAVIAYPVLVTALLHYINYQWPSAGDWGYEGLGLPAVLQLLVVCAPAAIICRARRRARSFGSGSDEGMA
jgi:hypothetical protein